MRLAIVLGLLLSTTAYADPEPWSTPKEPAPAPNETAPAASTTVAIGDDAAANPGGFGSDPAAAPPGLVAPRAVPIDVHREAPVAPREMLGGLAGYDASYDRTFLNSTALNLAPGHVDASARSSIRHAGILSVAGGITRGIEASVNYAKAGGVGHELGVDAKFGLVRHATWAAAMTAGVTIAWPSSSGDFSNSESQKIFSAGARISTCTGGECTGLFTFGGGFAFSDANYSSNFQPTLDASFIIGKGFVRPLLELTILGGEVGFAGARFGGRYVTVDAGVGKVWGDMAYTFGEDAMAMVGLAVRP